MGRKRNIGRTGITVGRVPRSRLRIRLWHKHKLGYPAGIGYPEQGKTVDKDVLFTYNISDTFYNPNYHWRLWNFCSGEGAGTEIFAKVRCRRAILPAAVCGRRASERGSV